jgi:PAS domain-containing protein
MKPVPGMANTVRTVDLNDHTLREDVAELRIRLNEAENALQAIRSGAVDAIVVDTAAGEQLFTLQGADQSYRDMIEASGEGAVTVGPGGAIVYSNQRFADMLRTDLKAVQRCQSAPTESNLQHL